MPSPSGADIVRPCVYCGRPVEQSGAAGRPFRYCRDNDGACQRNARNGRMRERNSPGLAGQVARSWELVERLELITGTLADALHAELSPAGVERQTAAVRAEAANHVASAHTDRDDARREAEAARAEAARLRDALADVTARAEDLDQNLRRVRAEATDLTAALADATASRDEARAAATADAALRAEALVARDRAVADAEAHRSAAERHRADADQAGRQATAALADADTARAAAQTAVANARESLATSERMTKDRDDAMAALAAVRAELAAAAAARADAEATLAAERDARRQATWERDAARAETATARAAVEEVRADQVRLVTEAAELRGALSAAQAEASAVRDLAAAQSAQLTSMMAAWQERTSGGSGSRGSDDHDPAGTQSQRS
jgi:chromosome segregation ATPase